MNGYYKIAEDALFEDLKKSNITKSLLNIAKDIKKENPDYPEDELKKTVMMSAIYLDKKLFKQFAGILYKKIRNKKYSN